MAYWLSNPDDNSNDYIIQAVETARDLLGKAPIVNETVSARYPGQSFRIGCGVHMGGAVLGSIGPDARRDLTMLGDSVNVTFRIEALCSMLGKDLLVSEAVKTAIGEVYTCSDMGMHDLKGKSEPLRIYAMN
jgi:adenylate cyclase